VLRGDTNAYKLGSLRYDFSKLRAKVSGVNYFFALTTIISPCQRQLLLDPRAARSGTAKPL